MQLAARAAVIQQPQEHIGIPTTEYCSKGVKGESGGCSDGGKYNGVPLFYTALLNPIWTFPSTSEDTRSTNTTILAESVNELEHSPTLMPLDFLDSRISSAFKNERGSKNQISAIGELPFVCVKECLPIC
jgi:hypothetical protein